MEMQTGVTVAVSLVAVFVLSKLFAPKKAKAISKTAETVDDGPETVSGPSFAKEKRIITTVDRSVAIPPRFAQKGVASAEGCPATTIPALFKAAAERKGHVKALGIERPTPKIVNNIVPGPIPLDQWKTWTVAEYYQESRMAAKAFITLGMEPLDGVCIYGFNSPEWVMSSMASILGGGITAGIYPTDNADQVEYKCKHAGSSIAVIEDETKLKVFVEKRSNLPKLKAVVIWSPADAAAIKAGKLDFSGVKVLTWDMLSAFAEKTSEETLEKRITAQQPGNVCALIYTSGTTGNPKAVMISHDNIIFESTTVLQHLPFIGGKDMEEERVISFLPLSHVAGMMVDIVFGLVLAAKCPGYNVLYFARPYDMKEGTLGDRLRTIRPTVFLGVPRVWEKVAEKMKAVGKSTTGLKKKIATWAKAKGLEHSKNCLMGGSGAVPPMYGLADKLVLSKVKAVLGLDKCKFGFTGAAPITEDTLEYFGSLGININEVYGMSECTGATTISKDNAHVWGSCGWAIRGEEVKIFNTEGGKRVEIPPCKDLFNPTEAEQGEICFRGRHIMLGYMANPDLGEEHVKDMKKKTDEAIDEDGWLHSGDKGCLDARGCLRITGRYKELIITAGGENIAPVPIEDSIKKLCPAISNAMMVGDKRKYNIVILTLKLKGATGELPGTDELDGDAATLVEGVTTVQQAVKSEAFIAAIRAAIKETNASSYCANNASKVQKFTILKRDFSVSTEELTPTLKTKRGVVEKMNSSAIDKVYNSKDDFVNTF
mmetsp:Transcript_34213/g.84131  ORF Transcript_34213/g.84131 Transcript_34213/m.84131 type:complete len:769 (-) Transcript_34213:214-2520(-)